MCANTVEPLLANPPNQGYNRNKASIHKDKNFDPNTEQMSTIHLASERGKPPYCSKKWPKKICSQSFHCIEASLQTLGT